MVVAEEAEVADTMEPVRQYVDQEATDELTGFEGHRFLAAAVAVVLIAKADFAIVHRHQAVVGDGDAMGIAPNIIQNLLRPGERPLGKDHPVGGMGWRPIAPERCRLLQVAVSREEVQFTGAEGLLQMVQEQAAEHLRQHPDRQEEVWPRGNPARAVWRDAAARNQAVQMRVVHEILAPGVQHGDEADRRAQMLGIGPRSGPMPCKAVSRLGGDPAQRLRRRPEQDGVDHGLVLERDDRDHVRHGEHDMEVGQVEPFRLPRLEPLGPDEILTLRTISIATRVVCHPLMPTLPALLNMAAKRGGAAGLDRAHGAPPRAKQRGTMLIAERLAEVAEHIRHFQPVAGHLSCAQVGTRSGTVGVMPCKASSGLVVAQTVLVAMRRYWSVVPRSRWPSSS